GILIFLFPIKDGSSFNIPLGLITEYLIDTFQSYLPFVITYVMIFSSVLTIINSLFKPGFIQKSEFMKSMFETSAFWLVVRLIGTVFAVMTYYQVGAFFVISDATGSEIMGLLTTLIMWFLVASFLMPFLIN